MPDLYSSPSGTVSSSVTLTTWWLRDPLNEVEDLRLYIVDDELPIATVEDQDVIEAIDRRDPVVTKGVTRTMTMNPTIDLVGYAELTKLNALRALKRTLLLQAPMYDRIWWVVFDANMTERVVNTPDDYVRMDLGFIEVADPQYPNNAGYSAANGIWGYGGSSDTTTPNAASPMLMDLGGWGVSKALWLPGVAGNYLSAPDVNLLSADVSSVEQAMPWASAGLHTIAASTDRAYHGSRSIKVTLANNTDGRLAHVGTVTLTAGQTYVFLVYVWVPVGWSSGNIALSTEGSSGWSAGGIGVAPTPGQWTLLSSTVANGVTGASAFMVRADGAKTVGDVVYIDAACIRQGAATFVPSSRITGDIDLRARVALKDWTPGSQQTFVSRHNTGTPSYLFRMEPGGVLALFAYPDTSVGVFSTVPVPVADRQALWVRVTHDVDNGAGGRTTTFWTSPDGVTWTQLGAAVTVAGVTSIANTASGLSVGARFDGAPEPMTGAVLNTEVRDGINGPIVASFDPALWTMQRNLLSAVDASVESGVGGWGPYAGTVTRDESDAYHGTACVKLVTDASGYSQARSGQTPVLEVGKSYVATAWVKGPAGVSFGFLLTKFSGASAYTQSVFTGAWQRVTTTLAFNDAASSYIALIEVGSANSTVRIDAVTVTEGSSVPASFFHQDLATDAQGNIWTVNRTIGASGSADIVDRPSLMGPGALSFPDRAEFDVAANQDYAVAAGFRTRSGASSRIFDTNQGGAGSHILYLVNQAWSYFWPNASAGSIAIGSSDAVNDGTYRVAIAKRVNGFAKVRTAAGTFTSGGADNGAISPSSITAMARESGGAEALAGEFLWLARFRRDLTAAEENALMAWNGSLATEPAWVREAATFYWNPNHTAVRNAYLDANDVLNLSAL